MKTYKIMIDNQTKYEAIWPFIKNGAIQRAKLKPGIAKDIKVYLRENIFLKYYKKSISENELWEDLKELTEWLEDQHTYTDLKKEYFGNAQKFINLTLKAMWITDWLKASPPHFPVDRIIQKAINTGRKYHDRYKWTDMSSEDYKHIIEAPKRYNSKGEFETIKKEDLAHWEVTTYHNLMNA